MTYKLPQTREIAFKVLAAQSPEETELALKELMNQDFCLYYKIFLWLFIRFDLTKLNSQLSGHISAIFKSVQNVSNDQFLQILKLLRSISIGYDLVSFAPLPGILLHNAEFLKEKVVNKEQNAILDEVFSPFSLLLNTIYRNTYLPPATALHLLHLLDSFLLVFLPTKDQDSQTRISVIRFIDHTFSEVTAYIFLLLNKELNGEEQPGHAVNEEISSLIKSILTISSQSQYLTIKCTLLSHSSKFLQNFISTFRSYLQRDNLEPTQLAVALSIYNSILDCYNREISYSIHSAKSFFIENELFNVALDLLSAIKKLKFSSGFTRSFEDSRQKFLVNYFLLISYDSSITKSPQYQALTQDIVENAQDIVDSHDIRNAQNLFGLLKVLYVPSFVARYAEASEESRDMLIREYKGIFDCGFRGLLQAEFYTFIQIKSFVEFIFDERLLADVNLMTSEGLKDCIFELFKECEKKYLVLRIFVNHFLKVMIKNPQIAPHYTFVLRKLLIIRVDYFGGKVN